MADTRKDSKMFDHFETKITCPYPAVGTKWSLSSWALGEKVIFEVMRWGGPVVDRLLRITHTCNDIDHHTTTDVQADKAREMWDEFVRKGLRPNGKCNITRGILTYD